ASNSRAHRLCFLRHGLGGRRSRRPGEGRRRRHGRRRAGHAVGRPAGQVLRDADLHGRGGQDGRPARPVPRPHAEAVQEARDRERGLLDGRRREERRQAVLRHRVPGQGVPGHAVERVRQGPGVGQGQGRVGEERQAGRQGRAGVPDRDGLLADQV
ncbi:MAG: NIPSNAP family containing protein, partial [uncultured Phycisphaerae bacterium]